MRFRDIILAGNERCRERADECDEPSDRSKASRSDSRQLRNSGESRPRPRLAEHPKWRNAGEGRIVGAPRGRRTRTKTRQAGRQAGRQRRNYGRGVAGPRVVVSFPRRCIELGPRGHSTPSCRPWWRHVDSRLSSRRFSERRQVVTRHATIGRDLAPLPNDVTARGGTNSSRALPPRRHNVTGDNADKRTRATQRRRKHACCWESRAMTYDFF